MSTVYKTIRENVLMTANKCVNGDRDVQYGPPEDNFKLIASYWDTYLNNGGDQSDKEHITALDVANMMILFKIARSQGGTGSMDNFIDICGYAACGGEIFSLDKIRKDAEEYDRSEHPLL